MQVAAVRRKRDRRLLLGLLSGGTIMFGGVSRAGRSQDGRPCRDGAVDAVVVPARTPVQVCWEQLPARTQLYLRQHLDGRYRKHQLDFLKQVEQDERLRNITCV